MRKTLVPLVLLLALCAPLALAAAPLPPGLTAPVAEAGCPPAPTASSTAASADFLRTLAPPTTVEKTIYTIGICSGSCDPATCVKGPAGLCRANNCYLEVGGMCPTGQTCIARCTNA
jgi:hypothetical protein